MSLTITARYLNDNTVAVYVDDIRWATLEYTYPNGYPLYRVNGNGKAYPLKGADLESIVIGE